MPCYDGREAEERENRQKYLDKLTRLLCESEKLLRNTRMAQEASDELKAWWVEHRQFDKLRGE